MLSHYLKTFSTLRSDTSRTRWTAAIKFRAPLHPTRPPELKSLLTIPNQLELNDNFNAS
jgi:hypothetical protein